MNNRVLIKFFASFRVRLYKNLRMRKVASDAHEQRIAELSILLMAQEAEERKPLLSHTTTANVSAPESSGEYSPTKLLADARLNVSLFYSLNICLSFRAVRVTRDTLCLSYIYRFLVTSFLSGSTYRAQETRER